MQKGAVVDNQCLVLLCLLLLFEDSLERTKDTMGNQLADGLIIGNALFLESWIGKIPILVDLSKAMFHHCVVKLQNDIEQLIKTMIPFAECFYPSVECFKSAVDPIQGNDLLCHIFDFDYVSDCIKGIETMGIFEL